VKELPSPAKRASPHFTFFAGKGGVGKTTCAAAAAVHAATAGHDVLVVSTDPAHSLGDALDTPLGARPRTLPLRRGRLTAIEIDAPAAFKRFLSRREEWLATIVERGTYLDREDVDRFVRLSLPGVDELVSLIELGRLAREGTHDRVVVDTAPTGHTLRLLGMPDLLARVAAILDDLQEKHRFLAHSLGGSYRGDGGDALVNDLRSEAEHLRELLRDPERAAFVWVTLPETLAMAESVDGIHALRNVGITVDSVVVNRTTPAPTGRCALCAGRRRAESAAIAALQKALPNLPLRTVPALSAEPRGPKALAPIAKALNALPSPAKGLRDREAIAQGRDAGSYSRRPVKRDRVRGTRQAKAVVIKAPARAAVDRAPSRAPWPWLTDLLPPSPRLVMFAGKGGVGKTTCAATTALAAAHQWPEKRWLLLSADPAHSIGDVLAQDVDDRPRTVVPSLQAREIDAPAALESRRERYRATVSDLFAAVSGKSGATATFDQRAVEDLIELAPPGIDEVFAILSVVDALLPEEGDATCDAVIIDAAPTGHALRLLAMPDLALEWVQAILAVLLKYREVVRLGSLAEELVRLSKSLKRLHALLRDRHQSAIVVVTRAAELPRLETERLLRKLARQKIPVSAVVVNATTPAGCPRCRRAAAREREEIRALAAALPRSAAFLATPAVAPPPTGPQTLSQWGRTWKRIEA
jgi:arsenite-transporting ATPase